MPTVSVYIRGEDWEAWRRLEKPSEFIHNALNPPKPTLEEYRKLYLDAGNDPEFVDRLIDGLAKSSLFNKPIKTPQTVKPMVSSGWAVNPKDGKKAIQKVGYRPDEESYSKRFPVIKQPQDIPKRDDPWEGPILKKGRKGKK